jgi:hypothetical protein
VTAFKREAEARSQQMKKAPSTLMSWLDKAGASVGVPRSLTADLLCEHGRLSQFSKRVRRLVPANVYAVLRARYDGPDLGVSVLFFLFLFLPTTAAARTYNNAVS